MDRANLRSLIRMACLGLVFLPFLSCDQPLPIGDDERYQAYPGFPYSLMATLIGNGEPGRSAFGIEPLETRLYQPQDVTVGPDGRPYILDWNNHRILVLDNHKVQPSVGTGELGPAHPGRALDIALDHPTHISFDPQGRMVIAAWHNSKILRYDLGTGQVETIAGTGERGYTGDGGPATEASLNLPVATAFDGSGRMFIADQANQCVRVVETDGTIRRYAGNGRQGFSGDGGPATEARLYAPVGQSAQPTGRIALDAAGNLYIADTYNHRIRMVDTDGIITTIAGMGSIGLGAGGYAGDEGPAVSAVLSSPSDVAVDSEGNLFIADSGNHCIRRIDRDGIITTLIGQAEEPGYGGDSDHPKWARLRGPSGIGLDDRDNIFIADTFNHRLRVAYKGVIKLD
ncbi:MAG TPA: hypothetical protein DIU35_15955 [Candidatus Latescibacteria bacterium]|nr:hypothetical protein [Candidatus Latescibacterota bacterium]